jgi:hypothetical protein
MCCIQLAPPTKNKTHCKFNLFQSTYEFPMRHIGYVARLLKTVTKVLKLRLRGARVTRLELAKRDVFQSSAF